MTMTGHNSVKEEADRQKLFAYYFRKEIDVETQLRALRDRKKSNRQNAKASGFPAAKIDHYAKAFYAEDEEKPVDRLKSDRENLEWLGLIPKTSDGDLLAQAERATGEDMVRAKGYRAGLLNLERVSGYMAATDEDRWWLNSYDAGKSEYDTDIPDILSRIESARSKESPPSEGDPFQTDIEDSD